MSFHGSIKFNKKNLRPNVLQLAQQSKYFCFCEETLKKQTNQKSFVSSWSTREKVETTKVMTSAQSSCCYATPFDTAGSLIFRARELKFQLFNLLRLSNKKFLDEVFSFLRSVSKQGRRHIECRWSDLSSNFLVDIFISSSVFYSEWQRSTQPGDTCQSINI